MEIGCFDFKCFYIVMFLNEMEYLELEFNNRESYRMFIWIIGYR